MNKQLGARRSFNDAARQLDDRATGAYHTLNILLLLDQRYDLGARDRRARSRSEHFGIDERPTKWLVGSAT